MTTAATAGEQNSTNQNAGKGVIIGAWIAQLVAAGILAMGALPKFFAYEQGPVNLAEALGVGRGVVTLIGVIEVVALALLLIPRLHVYGGLLAGATMAGALVSHVTHLGFTGEPGGLWIMAAIALVASLVVVVLRRRELPLPDGQRSAG